MTRKLSVDLPNRYYEALDRVAHTPGMAHLLAVFAIAHEEDVFKAGEMSSPYRMTYDTDYYALRDKPEAALGYEPHLSLSFDSIVQLGHTGCLIIYDEEEVRLSNIRKQVEQLLLAKQTGIDERQAS